MKDFISAKQRIYDEEKIERWGEIAVEWSLIFAIIMLVLLYLTGDNNNGVKSEKTSGARCEISSSGVCKSGSW